MKKNISKRRELKSRKIKIFRNISQYLSQKNITPNQISFASIGFALFGMIIFILYPQMQAWGQILSLIFIITAIQGRLLCNLLDGMVAIEGGKKTKSGELFNDIPDRISDSLFFIGCGFATQNIYGIYFGFLAALLAMATAYIRTLSASIDAPVSFKGPMAKQHRMAILTLAAFLTIFSNFLPWLKYSFFLTLIIICIGSIITCYNRCKDTYNYLESKDV